MVTLNDIISDLKDYNADEIKKMILSIITHYLKTSKDALSNDYIINYYKKIFKDDNIITNFKQNEKLFFPIQFEEENKEKIIDLLTKTTLFFTNDEKYSKYIEKEFLKYNFIENFQEYMDQYIDNEFKNIIGLDNIKTDLHDMAAILVNNKIREKKGLNKVTTTMHMVFLGNPGTGKTTIARIVGKIYNYLNIIPTDNLLEVTRKDLVAEYVGQTAIKTQKVLDEAKGGVLFIDEAYTLSNSSENDYGKEAIDTLLTFMENNRDDTIIIVAGYENLMEDFIKSNPGLESRFNKFFHFNNFNQEELFSIFIEFVKKDKFIIEDKEKNKIKKMFTTIDTNKENFSNARYIRNLYEKAITNQIRRVNKAGINEGDEFIKIIKEDIEL